ncbi:NUDIX domain-containing protein [Actinotalea sp. M2MS4P-6]|uniref:NUDIX hydrolase n=1 Tax=Actinotalea sp. M2MS4P-6 TaxID=2983762 RepID=UPI0021E4A107|nr:NUDIX domain-containing protein [Actinotalea sp. M2MS4P-6]MCV2396369.1 NUDIX domain-containing protein [Actinotalea sp. M2MS4P-6]
MLEDRTLLVAAAYLVLRRGDEVLLQLRAGTGYRDGHWALLAGHVDPGESVVDAVVREAHEEGGVDVDPADLVPLTAMHRFEAGGPPVEQRIDVFFETRRWTGEPSVREPHRTAAMDWFALDALPEPVVPHELRVLEALRSGGLPAVLVHRMDAAGERYS